MVADAGQPRAEGERPCPIARALNLPTPIGTSSTRTAAVGSPSPRRTPTAPTVPLPAEVRAVLSGIVKTLRNLPRDCIHDPPELFHFLNRQARALERVRDQPVPVSPPTAPRTSVPAPAATSAPRALSARDRAEAVFRGSGDPLADPSHQAIAQAVFAPASVSARPRIIMSRKGRQVRVEVRRARAAGQMELGL